MSFLEELKRRNVFRVAIFYLVTAWLTLQVSALLFEALELPSTWTRLVIALLTLGFPISLIFAWVFELTPEGLKLEKNIDRSQSITSHTGHKVNRAIIVMLALAIGAVVLDRLIPETATDSKQVRSTGTEESAENSIAVLPFVNMSEDKSNEHFGDGLAEELLNLLAKVDGLRVAARTSSVYFKDKDATIDDVAAALNVDTILEGSVRRSGDTIRVVAQLIRAEDSSHLWSEKYDRPLTDIFVVQDDIANQIVAALMPQLGADIAPVIATETGDITPAQFERFMLARQDYWESTEEGVTRARNELLRLTKEAPGYAPAWSLLANSWITLERENPVRTPSIVAMPAAEKAVATALDLDPDEATAYVARGRLQLARNDNTEALASFDHAIEIDPMLMSAYNGRQHALVRLGRAQEAIETLEYASAIDPLHPAFLYNLAHLRNLQGDKFGAYEALESLYQVSPGASRFLEWHLMADSQELARGLYIVERMHEDGLADSNNLARFYQWLGLHEEPMILETDFAYRSLAVLGRREEALATMEDRLATIDDPSTRSDLQWQTYVALGDYENARDVLWDRWIKRNSGEPGATLDWTERLAVGATLLKTGETEKLAEVATILDEMSVGWSRLHHRGYQMGMGEIAILNGDFDTGVAFFQESADEGNPGDWEMGGPVNFTWLLESDSRFEPILAQIVANRDRQLVELDRLRASGLTGEEVREEYLSSVESND